MMKGHQRRADKGLSFIEPLLTPPLQFDSTLLKSQEEEILTHLL